MKKILFTVSIFLFLSINIAPVFADNGLIVCGGKGQDPCTLCDFLNQGKVIVDFIDFTIVPALAVLMLAVAGVMYFLGGVDPTMVSRAKNLFKSIAIGLLIIYGAWLIVNVFFMMIGLNKAGTFGFDLKQWWNFPCE